jgi:hypothetical protein
VRLGEEEVESQTAKVHLKATVTFTPKGNCDVLMQLSNVAIEQADVSADYATELQKKPLLFSFDDGLIREICPDNDEASWILNVKRGILSTFQNAMEGSTTETDHHEEDVSGSCPTEFRRDGNTITKKKNLVDCKTVRGQFSSMHSVPYEHSKTGETPLLKSTQECSHVIESNQILKSATCTETHVFDPLKEDRKSAIITTTNTKLDYKKTENAGTTPNVDFEQRSTLKYDHDEFDYQYKHSSDAKDLAKNNLERLCSLLEDRDVRPETPSAFAELVYNLRKVKEADLKAVMDFAKSNKACDKTMKFFMDALPMCGSEACVGLMVDLAKQNTVTGLERKMFLTSLAFVPRPTLNMVKKMTTLVDDLSSSGLLGISSLVYGYCKSDPECHEKAEVVEFMAKLQQQLGEKCSVAGNDGAAIEKMVMILKSIGNVGHAPSLIETLTKCYKEETNPTVIRLAAIQALRRMPCQYKNDLLDFFKDPRNNVELRIAAFLGVMKCPCHKTIRAVRDALKREKVNQVGSFVWSYLKAKQGSKKPGRTIPADAAQMARVVEEIRSGSEEVQQVPRMGIVQPRG